MCTPNAPRGTHARHLGLPDSAKHDDSANDGHVPEPHSPLPVTLSDRIPTEIFEAVIDHMDFESLPTAALVSWAWLPRAVLNLYRTVRLWSRKAFNSLADQSRTSLHVKQMLSTARELVIERRQPSVRPSYFLDSLPLVLAHALPSLRVLDIRQPLRAHAIMHPSFYQALPLFTQLTSLHLHGVRMRNIAQLQRIIHAFPRLDELVLNEVKLMQASYTSYASQYLKNTLAETNPGIHLKRLAIIAPSGDTGCTEACESIVDWLTSSALGASPRHLITDIWFMMWRGTGPRSAYEQLHRLLRESGQSLEMFFAGPPLTYLAQDVADLRQPSPHANVHLETLTLPRTRPLALRGTVLVRNLHFEKRVAVRFTLDNWQTTSEVLCRHILNLASLPSLATQKSCTVDLTAENMDGQTKAGEGKGSWDRFGFTIQLDYDHRLADHALYLVVSYASGTAEWWDNDDGQNYKIRFCRAFVATAQSQ